MAATVTIQLSKPIKSAVILNAEGPGVPDEQTALSADLKNQKTDLAQLLAALKGLVDKLNQFYEKIFAGHKEEIAKLSVEIARKILLQKVQQGDYQIEAIVQEAIKNAPTQQDIIVHLNPGDLARIQKIQQEDASAFTGIKFVSDPNVGQAECTIETSKGIVESLINEHLEQISKALGKVE